MFSSHVFIVAIGDEYYLDEYITSIFRAEEDEISNQQESGRVNCTWKSWIRDRPEKE
jgi:hypothetical protein